MGPLLWEASVIHDPRRYRPTLFHRGEHLPAHTFQNRFVTPRRLGHQMMQRLVHPPDILRRQPRRHRFDTLALSRQQQPSTVGLQGSMAVGVSCGVRQGTSD
jgi:hypothetical protein